MSLKISETGTNLMFYHSYSFRHSSPVTNTYSLFSNKAEIGVKNIFSRYESQIHNVYDLKIYREHIVTK